VIGPRRQQVEPIGSILTREQGGWGAGAGWLAGWLAGPQCFLQLHAAKTTVSSKACIPVGAQQVEHVVASCCQLSWCERLQ
jgi:hypothetical protein